MSDKDPTRHHAEDTAFIQALAELLNRNELTELKVEREYGEDDRLTVELSKHGRQVMVQSAPVYAPQPAQAPAAAPAAPAAAPSAPASEPPAEAEPAPADATPQGT